MLANIHVLCMVFSIGVIFFADKDAFAWLRGTKPLLDRARMYRTHLLMWGGLLALMGTGVTLFLPRATYLLSQPLFIIKILFVAILFVNAVVIGRLVDVAVTRPYASLTVSEKLPLLVSGAVSVLGWTSVILIAFYLL